MARVKALHRVAIKAADLDATTRFYTDLWGLQLLAQVGGTSRMRTGASDHADFLISQGGKGLDHIAFVIADRAEGDALAKAGIAAGGTLVEQGAEIVLADPDGNRVHLIVPAPEKAEGAAPDFGPQKIGHVVLWAKAGQAMESFYQALGLRISDRTKMGMAFLRCNTDHHTLALVGNPNMSGLQHIAFDTVTIDNVMRQMGRLKKAEVPCIWGPGRHGPGNNVFTYYQDPAGSIIEFYGELEQVPVDDPNLTEKFWGPEHSGDLWGLAGPPPNVFKGLPA